MDMDVHISLSKSSCLRSGSIYDELLMLVLFDCAVEALRSQGFGVYKGVKFCVI